MGFLDKLFGKEEPKTTEEQTGTPHAPGDKPANDHPVPFAGIEEVRFGRYGDNNKSYAQTQKWHEAEDFFKDKKYPEAFAAFFEYISDKKEQNINFSQEGDRFTFSLIQGSKMVYGECDGDQILIQAPIAIMESPGVAAMRRLLDLNYSMYYSRTALTDKNELCILLDFKVPMASPNKLYYGIREIAVKADRLDDQLLQDFAALKAANDDHIQPVPASEKDIKYRYFAEWTDETIKRVTALNSDSFAGAIAYQLLTLLYRIEYLMAPEGTLLMELERISGLYWAKADETPLVERNKLMIDAITKFAKTSKEDFSAGIYRTTATFSVATPPPPDKVRDNIQAANRDAAHYVENKYPDLALTIVEYGIVYSLYAYSVPLIIKDLSKIFMATIHSGFFNDLGMQHAFYNATAKDFNRVLIEQAVNDAIRVFPDKYTSLSWDHSKIKYDSLYDFAYTFSNQMATLNLELKK